MSREKQIEEMAQDLCQAEFWDVDEDCYDLELDRRKTAENLYNAGYRKQEWISVEERLPEESGWYFVNIITPFDHEFVSMARYSKGYGWNNTDIVTHWMLIPAPPKMLGGDINE